MVETGGAEALTELLGEALLVAEHDARDHRMSLTIDARSHRPAQRRAQPVGEPAEASTLAEHAPAISDQHYMNSVPSQPRLLVEAMARPARGA